MDKCKHHCVGCSHPEKFSKKNNQKTIEGHCVAIELRTSPPSTPNNLTRMSQNVEAPFRCRFVCDNPQIENADYEFLLSSPKLFEILAVCF